MCTNSLEKAVLARTANAYQSHGQAERSADLLLTMAVVVVALVVVVGWFGNENDIVSALYGVGSTPTHRHGQRGHGH